MAVRSLELRRPIPEPTAFFRDDGITERPWGDVPLPWYWTVLGWLLRLAPVPRHVAMVPDGNRRFAKANGLPENEGHVKGRLVLEQVRGEQIENDFRIL